MFTLQRMTAVPLRFAWTKLVAFCSPSFFGNGVPGAETLGFVSTLSVTRCLAFLVAFVEQKYCPLSHRSTRNSRSSLPWPTVEISGKKQDWLRFGCRMGLGNGFFMACKTDFFYLTSSGIASCVGTAGMVTWRLHLTRPCCTWVANLSGWAEWPYVIM